MNSPETQIIQALAVCAELTNTTLSDAAMNVMLDDLLAYDTNAVLNALARCRKELTGKLTLAAIVARIETGLPSADEAFGMMLEGRLNENLTIVVPHIAQLAMQSANPLLKLGDKTGARMAFKAAYERLAANNPIPNWTVELGNDTTHRCIALDNAVKQGKLPRHALLDYAPQNALPTPSECSEKGREQIALLLVKIGDKKSLLQQIDDKHAQQSTQQHTEFEAKRAQAIAAAREYFQAA
nr:MAG TPA: replisome organizer [Bacteriophage sp.]